MQQRYIVPDMVIHLDVDDVLRKKRVEQRGYEVLPLLLEPSYNQGIREFYDAACPAINYATIKTDGISINEVTSLALLHINAGKPILNKIHKLSEAIQSIAVAPKAPFSRKLLKSSSPRL